MCYWKKSRLSSVGSKIKCRTIGEIVKEAKGIHPDKHIPAPAPSTRSNSDKFLQRLIERGIQEDKQNHLVEFFKPRASWEKISLHHLALSYSGNRLDIDEFLNYCPNSYTYEDCAAVANCTKDQSESPIWYEMRYGRITALILYETCRCRTTEGALFRKIMGGKMIETDAMARGRELEADVIKIVEELIGEKISKSGLLLSPMYPWFGASPDGVTKTAVIEVKCPMKVETVSNYYANNTVNSKFRA
ncbi:uncharacterized protein LOC135169524 [Diachasmimorpha longicaudata]|uniref:uncharacterized protein LOC135169524 n=1 Tax=Diachasmimorpha longicaudata TaxID=58733 RepID=UPI0030B8D838